jgi:hypothetical protein
VQTRQRITFALGISDSSALYALLSTTVGMLPLQHIYANQRNVRRQQPPKSRQLYQWWAQTRAQSARKQPMGSQLVALMHRVVVGGADMASGVPVIEWYLDESAGRELAASLFRAALKVDAPSKICFRRVVGFTVSWHHEALPRNSSVLDTEQLREDHADRAGS